MNELFENDLQESVDRLEKHSKDGFPDELLAGIHS